jgi:Fe-Mn family superoxide dismutase
MFVLPKLPFGLSDLEPHISAKTLDYHYGKHHQAYVNNLNNLTDGSAMQDQSLESIIEQTIGQSGQEGVFNNSAQIWNHTFFWHSLHPNGGGNPMGVLHDRIVHDFGSVERFKDEFKKAAISQFGSGWAWLVLEDKKLKIIKTPNAYLPLASRGQVPLLTLDVWEHAYYLDYQNRRPDFVGTVIDKLINWEFAAENLAAVS